MITLIAFTMSTGTVYVTRSCTTNVDDRYEACVCDTARITLQLSVVLVPRILVTECDLSAPSRRSLRVCTTIRPPESFLLAWSQRVCRKC